MFQLTAGDSVEKVLGESPPPDVKGQGVLSTKAAQARKELGDALDELGNYGKGKLFANPLADPKLAKLTAKIVRRAVRAGVLTFSDLIQRSVKRIGTAAVRAIGPALRREWDRAASKFRNLGLDASSDVEPILAALQETPVAEPTLAAPESGATRELMGIADALRKQAREPEREKDAAVWARGAKRLQKDFDGEKKKLLSGAQAEDADDVVASQGVLIQLSEAIGSGDVDAAFEAVQAAYLYRKQRTEAGRILRQGRWMARKAILLESLLAPPQDVQRKIDRAISKGEREKLREILADWAAYVAGPFKAELMAEGIDIDNIDALMADRKTLMRALRHISIRKSDTWDALYEWYSNAIFSGPLTQIVNLTGNILYGLWTFTVDRLGEAFVDAALRRVGLKSGGARFGELKMLWKGLFRAWAEGARNFALTFRDEWPVFLEEATGKRELIGIDIKGPTIPGIFGRTVRAPWRTMSAADDLSMTLIGNAEALARSYRQAVNEGLEGNNRESRMNELYNDRSSDPWTEAYAQSVRLTFKERGQIVEGLLNLRGKIPGARYVIPTVTTPVDLLAKGLRKTPLGTLALLRDLKNRDYSQTSVRAAEQLLAWGALLGLIAMRDPEDPWITGSRGTNPTNKYSVKIGDQWWNYGRIEPFATALGMLVDIADAIDGGDTWTMLQEPFSSLVKQIDQKTFLQQLSDLFKVIETIRWDEAEPLDAALKFAGNFFTGFVPNAVKAPIRAAKQTIPERRAAGPRGEKTGKVLSRIVQGSEIGTFFNPDSPKIDLWGRERMRDGSPIAHPATDFMWRLLVPSQSPRYDETVGDRLLYNWNRLHPDERYKPTGSKPYVTVEGQKIWLSGEQFVELQKRRGQMALELLQGYAEANEIDPTNPDEQDMDVLRSALSDGAEYAKESMLEEGLIELSTNRKAG
jgi:hypothetical protein